MVRPYSEGGLRTISAGTTLMVHTVRIFKKNMFASIESYLFYWINFDVTDLKFGHHFVWWYFQTVWRMHTAYNSLSFHLLYSCTYLCIIYYSMCTYVPMYFWVLCKMFVYYFWIVHTKAYYKPIYVTSAKDNTVIPI
jgi:hypothetical protein